MLRVSGIVYTLQPYTDNAPEPMRSAYLDYITFLSTLKEATVSKLTSIMLIVGSNILNLAKKTVEEVEDYQAKLYRTKNADFIASYVDDEELRLIEWVIYKDEGTDDVSAEFSCYEIDNKIIKALLLKQIHLFEISGDDFDRLISHFGLNFYVGKVFTDADRDKKHSEFVKKYNYYLHAFYSRSDNPDPHYLKRYLTTSELYVVSPYTVKGFNSDIDFQLTVPRNVTKDEALNLIDAYSGSMKHYIEQMYEYNYVEDLYKSTSGKGKKHYSSQFRKWDRCLRIYDLYKVYENRNAQINSPQIGRIGETIVKEFKVFTKYAITDLRKEVVKGYKEALRLIELSKTGYLY